MKLNASKFISLKEENKLFSTIAKSNEKSAIVDLMLFQLLSLTGLRISEAVNLKWADIGEDYLTISEQKNGEKSDVIIGKKLLQLLAQFKVNNPYSHSSYIFNTQRGQYSRTNAHEKLKEWLRIAKVRDGISCHSFRHSYATKCLDSGLPLTIVRDQLRHSDISVTSVYLHFTEESKNKLKENF